MMNTEHTRNWRDEAMNEALRGFNYSENLDALLREIRRAEPSWATQFLWADRLQVLNFLKGQSDADRGGVRSLLSAKCRRTYVDETIPYLDWLALTWQGAAIEVALCPNSGGDTICMSQDEAALNRFAEAMQEFSLHPVGRCLRYSQGWESALDLDEEMGKVTWADIVLPPPDIVGLRDAVEGFFAHRETIKAFGFAWRRGVLLIGPPGTGKTMVCKAAATALPDLPFLYVRDLREDEKKESIKTIFDRARKLAPCILAFEDIEGLISDDNRTVFLNEMDGFQSNEGVLVIASSNHPGKIDEALLKRPSRFDRVFHLGLPRLEERRAFCTRLLYGSNLADRMAPELDRAQLAQQVSEKTDGFTPAYLKEAFASAALQRAQQGATHLDAAFAQAVLDQIEELRGHLKRMKNPDALGEMRNLDDAVGFRR